MNFAFEDLTTDMYNSLSDISSIIIILDQTNKKVILR